MIIDAYTHCGLDKFLPVESVTACMSDSGVDRAVLCQHLGQTDNTYIAECVRSDPSRFAGVAMIDSSGAESAGQLASLAADGTFRGVRMTVDMLLANPGFASSALGLGVNVVLYTPDGLENVVDVIGRLPAGGDGGRLIITHLGCPQFEGRVLTRGHALLDCADATNAMVTLSGLGMYASYPYDVAVEFVRSVVSAFGADRLMWGSNFPVLGDSAAYGADLLLLLDNAWGIPDSAIVHIAGRNAESTWFR